MLEQSLLELIVVNLLSSTRLSAQIKEDLLSPTMIERLGDLDARRARYLNILVQEIDERHHGRFRLGDLATATDLVWPASFLRTPEIKPLDTLFDNLFIINGDYIHYRPEQLRQYSGVCSKVDPTVIVAWHLAKQFKKGQALDARDLCRVVDAQQPLFSPPPISNKSFAEGHVHFGGIHLDGIILMNQLTHEPGMEAFAPLHRLAHGLLGEWPTPEAAGKPKQLKALSIFQRAVGSLHFTDPVTLLDWDGYIHLQANETDIRKPSWLKRQIAVAIRAQDLEKAWLWLLIWLWVQYQNESAPAMLRMSIFYLVCALMAKRRELLMDGQGLSRFSAIYGRFRSASPTTAISANPFGQSIARKLFQGAEDVAEIKISGSDFNVAEVGQWIDTVGRHHRLTPESFLKPITEQQSNFFKKQMDRWHFCIHFLRRAAHTKNRGAIWQEADDLFHQLNQQTGWAAPGLSSEHFHFEHDAWVRGLDVAGDENLTRIELYAPMLRWLRSGLQPNARSTGAHSGFHFSIHAGEEYLHPLSGMRHIDETVQFCEMRHGDRLGHALALGIPPASWCANQGDMLLPVDEHLDNLVWLWHKATLLAPRLSLALRVLPRLERRIARFASLVPWVTKSYLNAFYQLSTPTDTPNLGLSNQVNPHTLHEAWYLRRNCFHMLKNHCNNPIRNVKLSAAVPDLPILSALDFTDHGEQRHDLTPALLYWRRSTYLQSNGKAPPTVRVTCHAQPLHEDLLPSHDKHLQLLRDHETEDDLELMEAIQDYLLDEYDQRGLIIETNPSSNVFIARLRSYEDHPIFRWSPPNEDSLEPGAAHNRFGLRRGPIRVTINTDDPGIIPTTLRTEYALLLAAAETRNLSRTQAEEWLERLRRFANDQFHKSHQTAFRRR